MSVSRQGHPRKYAERPPPCRVCGGDAWWNGSREVTRRRRGASGHVEVLPGERLRRACCSVRECPAPSWTVYPAARFPSRRFDLDVVASAVATAVFEQDDEGRRVAFESVGRRHGCSDRSVSRWTAWVAELIDIGALVRECVRIDPAGMPVALWPEAGDKRARAGHTLAALDRFATLLEQQGVLTRGDEPSLVRVLDDQRLRHGACFPLQIHSPPLSSGAAETAPRGG